MRGISKERLLNLRDHFDKDYSIAEAKVIQDLLNECQELQEQWMTLEEFLKKPKYEWCWIMLTNKQIHMAYISHNDSENYVFYLHDFDRDESYSLNEITHVMPIHKPELPR